MGPNIKPPPQRIYKVDLSKIKVVDHKKGKEDKSEIKEQKKDYFYWRDNKMKIDKKNKSINNYKYKWKIWEEKCKKIKKNKKRIKK